MKKLIIIVFVLAFAVAGCTTGNQVNNTTSPNKLNINTNKNNTNNTPMERMISGQEDLASQYKYATFVTNLGEFKLELYGDKAPVTVNNFMNLVKDDFYDNVKFHRVIKGFMIQAGDPLSKDDNMKNRWGTGGSGYNIPDEFVEGLSNVKGTISMANTGAPNSGGSQFFINVGDNVMLDFNKQPLSSKHPVFGMVIEGLDVIEKIETTPTVVGDQPIDAVIIENIKLEN